VNSYDSSLSPTELQWQQTLGRRSLIYINDQARLFRACQFSAAFRSAAIQCNKAYLLATVTNANQGEYDA
jgi:hypothetical protein